MLSSNLGDLLATMDIVKNLEGVSERDQAIVERRQTQESNFLNQVLDLAGTNHMQEASMRDSGTKYSDGEITLDFDDEDYAKTIMDLAQAKGVSQGEIVPERLKSGSVRLHIMPHVFASEQMESVRDAIGFGVEEDQVDQFDGLVKEIEERANPNHNKIGRFTSAAAVKRPKNGSRSFQMSAPSDGKKKRSVKRKAGDTYNKPDYFANRQFNVRSAPCGRLARPYYRKQRGMEPLKKNQKYIRCYDGLQPSWVREMVDSKTVAKEILASVLRDNLKARSKG